MVSNLESLVNNPIIRDYIIEYHELTNQICLLFIISWFSQGLLIFICRQTKIELINILIHITNLIIHGILLFTKVYSMFVLYLYIYDYILKSSDGIFNR